MYFTIIIGIVVLTLLWLWTRQSRGRTDLSHVPGMASSPWLQIFSRPDPDKIHLYVYDLFRKYGKVMKVPYVTGDDILLLGDYDAIYKVTVTEGKKFGGRSRTFRTHALSSSTGILMSEKPDATWKDLRKTSQRHLRQFGDGLSRLETIIMDIAEDMFRVFEDLNEKPFDPRQVIFDTGLNSIAFLIIGQRTKTGDFVVEKMREYERLFLETLSPKMKYMILDALPWLRHVGWPCWQDLKKTLELESQIWKFANDYADKNPGTESICKVLRDHIEEGNPHLSETDAIKATLALLLAGVTTTSNTFYGTINLLAHYPEVQENMHEEIKYITEQKGRVPYLQDRPDMPYSRACLLEILRITSVVAAGVSHTSVEDGEINGYKIPKGTIISINVWSLHNDEDFWENPQSFRPDRFLDDKGNLLPADHPNRKHLMPFGAGTRVCLGESLAMTRLFLWMITLVRRFKVLPAEGNHKSSTDSRQANFVGILKPATYNAIFVKR